MCAVCVIVCCQVLRVWGTGVFFLCLWVSVQRVLGCLFWAFVLPCPVGNVWISNTYFLCVHGLESPASDFDPPVSWWTLTLASQSTSWWQKWVLRGSSHLGSSHLSVVVHCSGGLKRDTHASLGSGQSPLKRCLQHYGPVPVGTQPNPICHCTFSRLWLKDG